MTRRHGAALALALVLSGCATTGTGSRRLTVRGPKWALAGVDVTLRVSTSGTLSGYELSFRVSVGQRIVGHFEAENGAARIPISSSLLSRGPNQISVETGSERSVLVMEVVPFTYAAVPAAALALVLAAVALARRRRRRVSG